MSSAFADNGFGRSNPPGSRYGPESMHSEARSAPNQRSRTNSRPALNRVETSTFYGQSADVYGSRHGGSQRPPTDNVVPAASGRNSLVAQPRTMPTSTARNSMVGMSTRNSVSSQNSSRRHGSPAMQSSYATSSTPSATGRDFSPPNDSVYGSSSNQSLSQRASVSARNVNNAAGNSGGGGGYRANAAPVRMKTIQLDGGFARTTTADHTPKQREPPRDRASTDSSAAATKGKDTPMKVTNPEASMQVMVPVRVEPRTFLANERTFLKWVRMALLLALLGVALISWSTERVTGNILIILGGVVMVRSLYVYKKRLNMIATNQAGQFDDVIGPVTLVGFMLFGLFLFVLYTSGAVGDGIIPGTIVAGV